MKKDRIPKEDRILIERYVNMYEGLGPVEVGDHLSIVDILEFTTTQSLTPAAVSRFEVLTAKGETVYTTKREIVRLLQMQIAAVEATS